MVMEAWRGAGRGGGCGGRWYGVGAGGVLARAGQQDACSAICNWERHMTGWLVANRVISK